MCSHHDRLMEVLWAKVQRYVRLGARLRPDNCNYTVWIEYA